MRPILGLVLAAHMLATTTCTHAPPLGIPRAQEDIKAAVEGPCRLDDNARRDVHRHPLQTLTWFGLRADQTVVEVTPGFGWYTEILAPLLRDQGAYVAAVYAPSSSDVAPNELLSALRIKMKQSPDCYDQAKILLFDLKAPDLGEPESADLVVTFRNVHNWEVDGVSERMFHAMARVLKVGGHLGVTAHRSDPERDSPPGYTREDRVVGLAQQAGLELVGTSEINANSRDTKDHPGGVWALPPTMAHGAEDASKYLAIGESDRMTLLFRKTTRSDRQAGRGEAP